jgi:DNA-binding MarR family transcriptional regulator
MHSQSNKPESAASQQGPLEMEGAHESIGFLLSRVGASVSEQFGEAMADHGLVPRQFLVLNIISEHEGESQQAVSESIGVAKSRMVGVIDELEEKELVERRVNPYDRRQHALFLTKKGRKLRDAARATAQEHEGRIRAALPPDAAPVMLEALQRLAELDDTPPGIHPALAKKMEMGEH